MSVAAIYSYASISFRSGARLGEEGKMLKNGISCNAVLFITLLLLPGLSYGSKADEEEKDFLHTNYIHLGVVTGCCLVSPRVGFWLGPVGIAATGGYCGKKNNGFQCNLQYRIMDNNRWLHSPGIAIERAADAGCEFLMAGVVYDFQFKGFFSEAGVGKVMQVWRGDFSDLPYWIFFQLGYVHRFVKKESQGK